MLPATFAPPGRTGRVFGPFYPPFLQEAVDHAERLIELIDRLDPHAARKMATTWLLGRAEEVECVVAEVASDWQRGEMLEVHAARSLSEYVQGLHRGLAVYFGELAPGCCIGSLVTTAVPASFLEVTASFPPSRRLDSSPIEETWGEVLDSEILDSTFIPGSP